VETNYILDLSIAETRDISLVGGKGASLGRMTQAGLPVPPGFCLSTAAYDAFLEHTGLREEIARQLAAGQYEAIREAIESGPLPPQVQEALVAAYRRLGNGPVAVRSSATAEDLPAASFAGQHHTALNVSGEEALVEAVKKCWASLWTERAVQYRERHGFAHDAVNMAVVVQQMTPAQAAGVLFTANPTSGDRNQMAIEGSWGLGEAVVAGLVTPDYYLVDKETLAVLERKVAEKTIMIVPDPAGGTRQVEVPPEKRLQPVLDDDQVRELAALARQVEALHDAPQDIEWALSEGKFYLLQARPITTLEPSLAEEPVPSIASSTTAPVRDKLGYPIVWSSTNTREVVPGVICHLARPLILTEMNLGLRDFLNRLGVRTDPDEGFLGFIYGRAYINMNYMLDTVGQLPGFSAEGVEETTGHAGRGGLEDRPRPPLLTRLGTTLRALCAFPQVVKNLKHEVVEFIKPFEKRVKEVRELDLTRLTTSEIRELLHEFQSYGRTIGMMHTSVSVVGGSLYDTISKLLAQWGGDGQVATRLLMGLTGLTTAEIGQELWQLAQLARQDEAVAQALRSENPQEALEELRAAGQGREFFAAYDDFLRRYGDRGFSELDLLQPRWEEDPSFLLRVLRNHLEAEVDEDPATLDQRQREERLRLTREIEEQIAKGLGGKLKLRFFRGLLENCQTYVSWRENMKGYWVNVYGVYRRCYLELARRWVEQGVLTAQDDIFYLEPQEVDELLDDPTQAERFRKLIAARRREYNWHITLDPPEVIIGSWSPAESMAAAAAPEGDVLTGLGASPGQVTAPARYITDPVKEGHIEPGEVLVAFQTDPGWTPLFVTAGGVVTELGGVMSHGAIVAREYGIPAVVGVKGATAAIRTGQTITVDGDNGKVHLHPVTAGGET